MAKAHGTVPGLVAGLDPRESGIVPAPTMYPDELRERSIRFACDLVAGPRLYRRWIRATVPEKTDHSR